VRAFHHCLVEARTRFATPGQLTQNLLGLLDDSGYLEGLGRMYKPREDALRRRDNVMEFVNEMAEYVRRAGTGATLRDFLESFALLDTNDREEKDQAAADAVTLMTVHAAKGLEFTLVCVVGMERGLFPHQRALEEHAEDEERRLFYVALTRAKQDAVLTYAETRRVRGDTIRRRPSPFLEEIPADLVEFSTPAKALKPAPAEVAADYLEQMRAKFAPKK
jgi:superfamily I DNA/RNA helicase